MLLRREVSTSLVTGAQRGRLGWGGVGGRVRRGVKACRSPHGITSSFVLYANPLLWLSTARNVAGSRDRAVRLPRLSYAHVFALLF